MQSITSNTVKNELLHLALCVRKLFPTLHHTVAAVIKIMPWPGEKAYYTLLCISEICNKSEEKGTKAKSHFKRVLHHRTVYV